jgi:hypothetical protein
MLGVMKDPIKQITKAVEAIESKGTRVVSFLYKGELRNAVVGATLPNGGPVWATKQITRSLWYANGHTYLVPRMMNDRFNFKAFDVTKIEDFSFKA